MEKPSLMIRESSMKKFKSPNSEAAQRWAIKHRDILNWAGLAIMQNLEAEPTIYAWSEDGGDLVAIFDLRDCYRKRQPLKDITKKLRKAIAPRRKKK